MVNFLFMSFVLIFICDCYFVSVFYKIISVLYVLQIHFLTYQMLLKLRKNSGGLVFVELPHFCGFHFQEPEQILKVNICTKFPSVAKQEEGEGKSYHSEIHSAVLYNKDLSSRNNYSTRASSDLGEAQLSNTRSH